MAPVSDDRDSRATALHDVCPSAAQRLHGIPVGRPPLEDLQAVSPATPCAARSQNPTWVRLGSSVRLAYAGWGHPGAHRST